MAGEGRRCSLPGGAAEEGGEAGEEDVEVEGFGEVVVRAGGEAFEDVFGAAAGGEEEDGGVVAGGAEGAGDGEAVLAGEHDVEEDGGGGIVCLEKVVQGVVAVGFVMGSEALGLQVKEEALGEVVFVFDDGDEGWRHGCSRFSLEAEASRQDTDAGWQVRGCCGTRSAGEA